MASEEYHKLTVKLAAYDGQGKLTIIDEETNEEIVELDLCADDMLLLSSAMISSLPREEQNVILEGLVCRGRVN